MSHLPGYRYNIRRTQDSVLQLYANGGQLSASNAEVWNSWRRTQRHSMAFQERRTFQGKSRQIQLVLKFIKEINADICYTTHL